MVVVSIAAFHAGVKGLFPGLGGLKYIPSIRIVGSLHDREVACSTSDI